LSFFNLNRTATNERNKSSSLGFHNELGGERQSIFATGSLKQFEFFDEIKHLKFDFFFRVDSGASLARHRVRLSVGTYQRASFRNSKLPNSSMAVLVAKANGKRFHSAHGGCAARVPAACGPARRARSGHAPVVHGAA